MRSCELLIVAALRLEAVALANAFHLPHVFPLIYTPNISLALVGPRATLLATVAANVQPKAILLAGLGGGLLPSLRLGDVVISTPNDHLIQSSEILVATPAEKGEMFRKTRAHAVDMETGPVRAFAASRNVPCTVIRAISDTARDALDPAVLTLVDPAGNARTARAVTLLLRHPGKLQMLLQLNRASKIALSKLTAAVTAHVRSHRLGAET